MSLPIKNVAIIGATGHIGTPILRALQQTSHHTITALTRANSPSSILPGIHRATIDYADPSTLVRALHNQDALIITLPPHAHPEIQLALFRAAAEARVKYILPNEWGVDTLNPAVTRDIPQFARFPEARRAFPEISAGTDMAYIALVTGFWYEWSLAIPSAFGFDMKNKSATLFDDGSVQMNVSTWRQVGRAVAKILSLPERDLAALRNRVVYISSFRVSQREMFASLLRVTDSREEEWKVVCQPAVQRFEDAVRREEEGDGMAFVVKMYTRLFYPDGAGEFESTRGLGNGFLQLPREELDEATARAVELAKGPSLLG